jgi:hypothetical protein
MLHEMIVLHCITYCISVLLLRAHVSTHCTCVQYYDVALRNIAQYDTSYECARVCVILPTNAPASVHA